MQVINFSLAISILTYSMLLPERHSTSLGLRAKIIGGSEVGTAYSYIWFVSIQRNNKHICGGVLLKADTVLTAKHCRADEDEQWSVVAHRHDLKQSDTHEKGQRFQVIDRIEHDEYDAVILKLSASFLHQSYNSDLIRLDDGTLGTKSGLLLNVIGWGIIENGNFSSQSNVLMETKVPIYDELKCDENYSNAGMIVSVHSELCAGFPEGGHDSCALDSGGPLFKMAGNLVTLVGITSHGAGCALPDFPGIYVRISAILDFIRNSI